MRNFEERRAQIFERSENRIKARKRARNQAAVICVPLCLAVIICSAALLPQMRHKGISDLIDENASYELLVETEDFEYVVITDSGKATQSKTIENGDKVDEIYTAISRLHNMVNAGTGALQDFEEYKDHTQSNYGETQEDSQNPPRDEVQLKGEQAASDVADENHVTGSSGAKTTYTICFVLADGSQLKYELRNNELVNLSSNKRVRLADEQIKELLQLFESE